MAGAERNDAVPRRSTLALDGMSAIPVPPAKIRNIPHWEEECRQIHARARDLIEGKITAIQAADALHSLAIRTHALEDQDMHVFTQLWSELVGLPVGGERQYWSPCVPGRSGPHRRRWAGK
jgi:hypothetical protein